MDLSAVLRWCRRLRVLRIDRTGIGSLEAIHLDNNEKDGKGERGTIHGDDGAKEEAKNEEGEGGRGEEGEGYYRDSGFSDLEELSAVDTAIGDESLEAL